MIPVLLKLSNFTSYGVNPLELDFTKFHLAAISGLNGAGKSSLLDSITWCIWGFSRAGDSADDLIRLGQNEMQVEFSFELDGNQFTIKRTRSKKSGGHTALEFWSAAHNLTEGTIKVTQQKIIDTLHLSYETFTNSAFLRQSHADEFTTKGPTDRKRILADILGLDHYDKLEEKAKEKAKDAQIKLTLLEYQILEIEVELSQKEEREKNLSEIKKQGEEKQKQLKEIEALIKTIEDEKQIIQVKVKSLQEQKQRFEALKKEIEALKLQTELKKKAQEEYKQILERKEEIEKHYQQIQTLQQKKKQLEDKRSELIKIKDKLAEIEKQINEREQKRTEAINRIELQIKQLETENQQYLSQIETLKKDKAICPTCGQPIGMEKNTALIAKYQKLVGENETKLKELKILLTKYRQAVLPEYKLAEIKSKEVKSLEEATKEYGDITTNLITLEKYNELYSELQQAEVAVKTYAEAIADLEKMYLAKEKELAKATEHEEESEIFLKRLSELEQKLVIQNQIRAELQETIMDLRAKYGEASQLVSRVKQMEDLFEQKQREKKQLTQEKETYEELALAFGKKGIQVMIIENAIPEIEDETNRLLDRLTEGRMKVRLDTQKETKTKIQTSEGKIHATVETLDIIISDEMGERAYEMYSVDGSELVYVKENGQIKSLPLRELWDNNQPVEKLGEYEFQKSSIDALCYVEGKALWQKVDKILRHKAPKKLLKVTCSLGGYSVKLTKNHSVYVITPEGIKVKRADNLKVGDFLLSPKVIPQDNILGSLDLSNYISKDFVEKRFLNHKPLQWDDNYIWSRTDQRINRKINLDSNFGRLAGVAVTEGFGQTSYTISAGTSLEFAQEALTLSSQIFGTKMRSLILVDQELMKKYTQKYPGLSSITPKSQYRPFIGGKLIAHIFKNMVGEKASLKKIPSIIFNASDQAKLEFIKGLVKGDGHLSFYPNHSKSSVSIITTVSYRLAGGVVFLCRQLGIWARIENHGDSGYRRGVNHQKSYRIVISGKKNIELLGLGKIASKYDTAVKYEGIPYELLGTNRVNGKRFRRGCIDDKFNCGTLRIPKSVQQEYSKIQGMIKDWNIVEIKKIEEVEPTDEYVYDLMVPGNNSFVAGSGAILVHNSGGEAFRVNLAIRLAISKLLTHRAGAKLQFLILDEGFGTQDAPGRARLVEVLDIIKDDFEKIVVITHIEELKEEFPVRIEVYKTATGSTFEVVGA